MSEEESAQQIGSALVDDDPKNQMMSAKMFSAKFRSKREVWNFLSVSKLNVFLYSNT